MIEVIEITKYRTSDGIEFYEEEDALAHEAEFMIENISAEELIVKTRSGKQIELSDVYFSISSAYYVEVKTDAALKFFNDASEAEGLEGLPHAGIFRYDEYTDKWISPQDDVSEIQERWRIFNENINFTTVNMTIFANKRK